MVRSPENRQPENGPTRRVGPAEFAQFVRGRMAVLGQEPQAATIEPQGRSRIQSFELPRPHRSGRPNPDRLHVAELLDDARGTVYEITDDNAGEVYTVDPLLETVQKSIIGEDAEPTAVDDLAQLQSRMVELGKGSLTAQAADKIGARGTAAKLRGEKVEPLTKGQVRRRITAAGVAGVLLIGTPIAIAESSSTSIPSEPGAAGPAVPGQEQEKKTELEASYFRLGQSLVDDLKNPNLKAQADADGRGYTNSLQYYRTDGQEGPIDSEAPLAAHNTSVRVETSWDGTKATTNVIIQGFTNDYSTTGLNDDINLVFRVPDKVDTLPDGTLSLDEISAALGSRETTLRFANVINGREYRDNSVVSGHEGVQVVLGYTPEGKVLGEVITDGTRVVYGDINNAAQDVRTMKGSRLTEITDTNRAGITAQVEQVNNNLAAKFRAASTHPHGDPGGA